MVVEGDGDVGIGTTTPGTRLHLYENSNSQTILKIENDNTGSSSAERLSFDNEDGSLAYIATYDDGSALTPSSMVIANNRPSGDLRFRTDGTDRLRVSNFGATYVTAPGGSPLQCSTSGYGYIEIATTGYVGTGLKMTNDHRTWYLLHSPSGADRISIFDNDVIGTRERLTVLGGTGSVGIHNTSPERELDISGKMRAMDDVTSAGWVGEFKNTNVMGTGLTTTGNNVATSYYSGGAGLNCSGYHVGAYVKAANTSSNGGQRSIYCYSGTGSYAYVCYRHTTGTQYDIYGPGLLASTMSTSKGYKALVAPESPEAWIEDYGSAEIKDGVCHVDLDPMLLDCVTINAENPAKVFIQMTSPVANQFYVEKGTTGFDVIVLGEGAETVDGTFDYRVVAARKDQEKLRFVEAESPEQVAAQSRTIEHQAEDE
jgi:hypothetical protein